MGSGEELGNLSLKPIFSPNSLNVKETSVLHFVPPLWLFPAQAALGAAGVVWEAQHWGFGGVWAALGSLCFDKAEVVWGLHQAQFAKVVVEIFRLEQLFWGSSATHLQTHNH